MILRSPVCTCQAFMDYKVLYLIVFLNIHCKISVFSKCFATESGLMSYICTVRHLSCGNGRCCGL